jgi:hypothetical protein
MPSDPWLSLTQRHDALWAELETDLHSTTLAALSDVLAKLWRQVLGERVSVTAAGQPDLSGLDNTARTTWRQALERWVKPVAYSYWRRKYSGSPTAPIDAWWSRVLAGMLPTSDRIVEAVKDEIRQRPSASIPQLREHIARVLGMDAGTRSIRNEIATVEAHLTAGTDQAARLSRRTTLLAELFRAQAAQARASAYGVLGRIQPDETEQFDRLAQQLERQFEDDKLTRILLRLERLDEQIYAGRGMSGDERTDLLRRRRELYEQAAKDEETWRNRATVAARTLSTDVLNEAAQQKAYADETAQGIALVKVWLAASDNRTRPTHRAAHGQVVGSHEQFLVGTSLMDRPGDPDAPLDEVIQCRCSAAYLTRAEHEEIVSALTAAGGETTVTETALEDLPPVMWHGVITVEGEFTGDRRKFQPGSIRTQALPMPIRFQREDLGGHTGAVVIANMEAGRRYQGQIRAWGTFADGDFTPEANEVQGLMATQMMRGVSIDGDDVLDSQFSVETDPGGSMFEIYDSMRLRSATFVAIPAFDEAQVFLGPPPDLWLTEGEPLAVEQNEPETAPVNLDEMADLVAAISRMPENLAEYWAHGEGAAKIGWGRSGDFDRCRRQLAKYVNPGQLSGVCANLHHRALGVWPGQEAAGDTLVASLTVVESGESAWTADDFEPRELDGPTPLVITDDGQVYGHLALWKSCHTGFSDMCVSPPKSYTGYRLFHTGAVRLGDGTDLPVGKLTVGAGHADSRRGMRAAVEHYDNSAVAAAVVRASEDVHGIQVSGRIIPGTPVEVVEELLRSPLSGDWRTYDGNLELVAALGVNTPGFPVPRVMVASADGRQLSLVAAGAMVPDPQDRIMATVARMADLRVRELASKMTPTGGGQ